MTLKKMVVLRQQDSCLPLQALTDYRGSDLKLVVASEMIL